MTTRLRTVIRLRAAARVRTGEDGATRLVSPSGGQSFGVLTSGQRLLLDAVAERECDEQELLAGAVEELPLAYALLAQLHRGNWLAATLLRDDRPVLTVVPAGRPTGTAAAVLGAAMGRNDKGTSVLSRFALVRRNGSRLVVESPRCGFAVEVDDPALLRLDDPVVVAVLAECGLAVPELSEEDTDVALAQWSPHELWFHARTRQGRHDLPWGATRRFPAPPAHRAVRPGRVHRLPRPDPAAVAARDPRLTEVMETRRSVREHDDAAPMTATQLGEFLHRTARTRSTVTRDGVELADRPHPSGGALHELEIYPVVGNVAGVPPGLHHYDPNLHHLTLVAADSPVVRGIARGAAAAAGTAARPQVLFVITARFGRVMWKYESMGYALTLKNVGVLMSAMYLVATAMNLAPCALGGGDSDLFGRVAGLDYESESSVGEFLLGTPAA